MPYLSGFLSEKYSYSSYEMKERIEQRIQEYASSAARNTISGYATTTVVYEDVRLDNTSSKYVLLPVWLLNYRYLGKNFVFAMNGQTGKVVGDLPVSKKKAAGWFVATVAITFVLLRLLGNLFF